MGNYEKYHIKSNPFPLYKKEHSVFNEKDFLNYYIFVNPYHQIISSRYNWSKIFADGTNNEFKNASPERNLTILYLDLNYFSFNNSVLDDFSVALIESSKSTPTTVRDFISKDELKNNSEEDVIQILKSWISYGLIYLSKNQQDFIIQQHSEVYAQSQENLKTQISSCLKQILNHYQLDINNELITQCDNNSNISLVEITQLLEKLNFETKAVRGNWDSLSKIPLPAITLVKLRDCLSLYCTIHSVSNENISIFNTEQKDYETYSKSAFLNIWDGILIIMLPNC